MDKTISISLGGFAFIIDDSAYQNLKKYLYEIRLSLNNIEGIDDIISDVEIRIAELLKERLKYREVVNDNDINHVISVMGQPEQYNDEPDFENQKRVYDEDFVDKKQKRKLFRDPKDKIIGGVASGIAHYFGVEPWIVRLIWTVLIIADLPITGSSFTIIVYIVLFIILPKAETATQRYEMFGEVGDFNSIKKNAAQTSEVNNSSENVAENVTKFLKIILKVILFIIGASLFISGIIILIALIVGLIMNAANFGPWEFPKYLFESNWQGIAFKVIFAVLALIPGILLVTFGAKLMFSRMKLNRTIIIGSLVLWLIALFTLIFLAFDMKKYTAHEFEFSNKEILAPKKDTIYLSFNSFANKSDYKFGWHKGYNLIPSGDKFIRKITPKISVKENLNDQIEVEIIYKSKGKDHDDALKNAEEISYSYKKDSLGKIVFDQFISLPANAKFRKQNAEIIVHLPKGKVLNTGNIRRTILYDNDDSYTTEKDKNKFYSYDDGRAVCLNCNGNSNNAKLDISSGGMHIESGSDKIIINADGIKIRDGKDSVDINFREN